MSLSAVTSHCTDRSIIYRGLPLNEIIKNFSNQQEMNKLHLSFNIWAVILFYVWRLISFHEVEKPVNLNLLYFKRATNCSCCMEQTIALCRSRSYSGYAEKSK